MIWLFAVWNISQTVGWLAETHGLMVGLC